jgi:methylated-DNA-[protein]-cysteine S-methyltransferase
MAHLSIPSPLGPLTLFEEDGALVSLDWGQAPPGDMSPLLEETERQVTAYFEGDLKDFDLPVNPAGTAFQRRLWLALQAIPFGQTVTYGELARRLDSEPRAIGGACGRNPLPIIIPCHRVLAAQGKMGGYSGLNHLETKRFLLELEGVLPRSFL